MGRTLLAARVTRVEQGTVVLKRLLPGGRPVSPPAPALPTPAEAGRLASVLLRLAAEPDSLVDGLSHHDVGDMVGAYRETVTKVLDEFQVAGYVELGRRRIRVVDRHGLPRPLDE